MIQCENCGMEFPDKDIIVSVRNGCDITFFCRRCASLLGHCPTCENMNTCGFHEDPDPTPKTVTQNQTRQTPMGAMTIQQQVVNPERIKKFCLNCHCCGKSENGIFCCRAPEIMTCANYIEKEHYEYSNPEKEDTSVI